MTELLLLRLDTVAGPLLRLDKDLRCSGTPHTSGDVQAGWNILPPLLTVCSRLHAPMITCRWAGGAGGERG